MRRLVMTMLAAVTLAWACSDASGPDAGPGEGVMKVRLTDRPFWADSVEAVNIFVVRIDARRAEANENDADAEIDDDQSNDGEQQNTPHGWITIARPDAAFNLLVLHDGVTAFLGETAVDTGLYRAMRLIIDPDRSSIVLKNGTTLSGEVSPFARFPSARHSGLKINFSEPIHIDEDETTNVLIDFDLEQSFVMRGNTMQNGMLMTPVLRVSVTE